MAPNNPFSRLSKPKVTSGTRKTIGISLYNLQRFSRCLTETGASFSWILTNHVMASHGFQPQRPLTALEQQIVDIENAGGDPTALLSQLEAQPVQPFINPLSLGVHPPRTTLKLNCH